jgi:hypothetical protein
MDNDDGGSSLQFRIEVYLDPGNTYILVVTTHRESVTGIFTVIATGPASVRLVSFTPTTRPSTRITTTERTISSMYMNALLPSNPVFYRPDGDREGYYYYDAIEVTVPTSGNYYFTSSTYMDTVGYLYNSFNPSDPATNMIISDDNSGIDTQFRLGALLEIGRTYVLVITTSRASVTGYFWVSAIGPASANLKSIASSTGITANNPNLPTTPILSTTLKSSASIKTNSIATAIICMLIIPMLQMLQQRFF